MRNTVKARAKWRTRLFVDALPEFAVELAALLKKGGYNALAAAVPLFYVVGRRCEGKGEYFASLSIFSRSIKGLYGMDNIDLDTEKGLITLRLENGRVVAIEVLFREDVRRPLLELFP